MARPVNADTEVTQKKIFAAASFLFARQGLEGTSVRQIASRAGVSIGLIRHYFGSKEGLYQACVDETFRIFGHLTTEVAGDIAKGAPMEDILEQGIRKGFLFVRSHRDAHQLTLQEELRPDSRRQQPVDQIFMPFNRFAQKVLAPRLRKTPREVSLIVRSMILLVSHYAVLDMEELARIIGVEAESLEERERQTVAAIEQHLVDVVKRLTGLGGTG